MLQVSDGESAVTGDCLDESFLELTPEIQRQAVFYESMNTQSKSFDSYRGLTRSNIEDLVTQGDSRAMVVRGAMAEMEARGYSDSMAFEFLWNINADVTRRLNPEDLSEEQRGHLQEAADYYYQAALNGRLLVLPYYGAAVSYISGGPVEQGWIDKVAYDQLDETRKKKSVSPAYIFYLLAFDIAPGLYETDLGRRGGLAYYRNDVSEAIVAGFRAEFEEKLAAGSADREDVIAKLEQTTPIEEILQDYCDSVQDKRWRISELALRRYMRE